MALGTTESTPGEIADKISLPLGTVAYHVRAMCEAGVLSLTRTTQVRGAIAHHYRATPNAGTLLADLTTLTQEAARRAPMT